MHNSYFDQHPGIVALITFLVVWELVWKGLALWRAGRNKRLGWFVAILVINTAGILPIVYLLAIDKKDR